MPLHDAELEKYEKSSVRSRPFDFVADAITGG